MENNFLNNIIFTPQHYQLNIRSLYSCFNIINEFIFILNSKGNLLFCNDYSLSNLKYSIDELLNKSFFSIAFSEENKSFEDFISIESINTNRTHSLILKNKYGKFFHVQGSMQELQLGGQILYFFSCKNFSPSISETLNPSTETYFTLFKDVIDSSETMIFVKDLKGRYILFNKKYETVMGISLKDARGKDVYELHSRKLAEEFSREDEIALSSDEPLKINRTLHIDGQDYQFITTKVALKNSSGEPYAICGIISDVTKLKKTEERLKHEWKRLYTLLDSLPVYVYLQAPDYTIRFANKTFKERFGDYTGKYCYEIIRNRNKPCQDCLTFKPFKTNKVERWHNISHSEHRIYDVYDYPFTDFDGSPLVLEMGIDITEQKTAEKEKERLQDELFHSSKMASLGILAEGIGHEINNPLAIMKGYIDCLQNSKKINEIEYKETIDKIEKSIERIRQIVEGLRTFARSDKDTLAPVNLHNIINENISLVSAIYEKEGIHLIKNLQARHPFVVGNHSKLQQVFMNLLSNSKDALETIDRGTIEIDTFNKANRIIIKVKDNGCGIKEADQKKIFDTFFTTKAPGKGMGLGLGLSHSTVYSHKGTIHVHSKENEGSEFTVTFPTISIDSNNMDIINNSISTTTSLNGKVLVVDDEPEIRDILKSHLSSFGLSVDEASDGINALNLTKKKHYKYIITDLKMPNMCGEKFIHETRQINSEHDTKIIVITGGIFKQHQLEQSNEKIDAFLPKPFSRDDILHCLCSLSSLRKDS